MQILLIVQVGSYNWGCTERRKHFSKQKLYILSLYLHSQNFFLTIFSFYHYRLLMVKKVSFAFSGSFSFRRFSFVCSRESDVFFVSFSNVASNGLFLCIVYYCLFFWSENRRHSVEMF